MMILFLLTSVAAVCTVDTTLIEKKPYSTNTGFMFASGFTTSIPKGHDLDGNGNGYCNFGFKKFTATGCSITSYSISSDPVVYNNN